MFVKAFALFSAFVGAAVDEDLKSFSIEGKCTTMAIGRKATTDGSTMCSDTMDCQDCDWRMSKVEAKDWPEGSMRPIYAEGSQYPRYIRSDRGYTWSEENLEPGPLKNAWIVGQTPIIGYIPQVPHTYALLEGLYGYMNEFQVSMGESTCAARLFAGPVGWQDGKALLNIGDLIQLGLERGKTAREAIQVMGDLAQEYGFYGESWDPAKYGDAYVMGEAGEGLSVIDPDEAWLFHILPDDTGKGAVWAAQRVPDDHIGVIANTFVIRHIDTESNDFMYSSNIFEVAKRKNFWDGKKKFDFKTVYSPERYHPEYSNNRVWRVFTLANTDSDIPLDTDPDANDYPVTMQVNHKISVQEMISYQRDYYQGTKLDMRLGMEAGPMGDPNRYGNGAWGNMTIWDTLDGTFARSISLFRTSTAIVAQARRHVPDVLAVVWVSAYAPDMSSFVPFYVASTKLSKAWTTGSMHAYDSSVAWWNFCVVGNYVARYYHFAVEAVREVQNSLQDTFDKGLAATDEAVLALLHGKNADSEETKHAIVELLTTFTVKSGDLTSQTWKDLFPKVLTTYRDGFIIKGLDQVQISTVSMFYPRWWLEAVGYFTHPGNPDPDAILFAPSPFLADTVAASTLVLCVAMSAMVFAAGGYFYAKKKFERSGYTTIPSNGGFEL